MKGDKYWKISCDIERQNNLIWSNLSAEEKIRNVLSSVYYLRRAAYLNHPEAQYELACFYEFGVHINGIFLFRNRKKMVYWTLKAANNNHPEAVEAMAMLYESDFELQNLDKALEYYKLYENLKGLKISRNRKLFTKQLEKGLFVKNEKGYFELKKDWKELIRL
jgi:hypothetical protein